MRPVRLVDLPDFRFLSAVQFSPDGAYAAYVVSRSEPDWKGYAHEIWLYDVETGKQLPLTAGGKEKSFIWEDNGSVLFAAQRTEDEKKKAEASPYTAFYRVGIHGGEARFAFDVPLRNASLTRMQNGFLIRAPYNPEDQDISVEEPQTPKANVKVFDEIPFWFNGKGVINKKRTRLYRYNEIARTVEALTPELGEVGAVAVENGGTRIAYAMTIFEHINPQAETLHVYDSASGETMEIAIDDAYRISNIAFAGNSLLLAMSDGKRYGTSENDRLYRYDLLENDLQLIAAPDVDLCGNVGTDCKLGGGITFKMDGMELYLTLGKDNSAGIYRMSENGELTACTDGEGSVDCFDVHQGTLLFVAMRNMGLQELYHLRDGKAVQVSRLNEACLEDVYVADPRPLSFINGDGVRIDGWVMPPLQYDPHNRYPAILNIHGGPKSVFGRVFHHEMQLWASSGYFVFFCNPRGSGGRGDEFADLRGKYGTIDYSDLMMFTDRVLEAYPAIDHERLCVAGGSYGGFMVNWIIGHTDRFAAAASQRSIANWTSKCLTTDIGYYHNLSQIAGDPWSTPELFWEKSPLKYAPAVHTPTLFIHSDEDYRCWMSEALQMFTALKMHGVPTRLCLFGGENHDLSRSGTPAHRIRRLHEIVDWFDYYVGKET